VPLFFGGYYHDSIEDARLTYNDVMKVARNMMTEEQALMATEIVYALTNEKGRTRAERAGEKYYQGIREMNVLVRNTIRVFVRLPMLPLSSCATDWLISPIPVQELMVAICA